MAQQVSQAQGVPNFNDTSSSDNSSHPVGRLTQALGQSFFGNPLWEYAFFVLLVLAAFGTWHYFVTTLHSFTKRDL